MLRLGASWFHGEIVGTSIGVEHISKTFAGFHALSDVSLAITPGRLHALIGANGSGKSTIAKIISGNYRPDKGSIFIGDRRLHTIGSPLEAQNLGIRVVHQEAPLIDSLSVAECMALFHGFPTTRYGRVQWKLVRRQAAEQLSQFGLKIDIATHAKMLSAAQRACVALAVAIGDSSSEIACLVLDEVTASIPETEAEQFLSTIRAIVERNVPVLMITHRLSEVVRFADDMTVLREGVVAFSGPVDNVSRPEMVELMSGEHLNRSESVKSGGDDPVAACVDKSREIENLRETRLAVEHLRGATLRDVSFSIRYGEVLGVVGGAESGVEELPLVLAGLLPASAERLAVWGNAAPLPSSPRVAQRNGIMLVPRDRLRQGAVGSLTVEENIILPRAREYWHRGVAARKDSQRVIEEFGVRPPHRRALARVLSGGNLQKVILGKWLNCGPRILILDDPGQGVDPASREQIFTSIRNAAQSGLGVLVFSTEPEELARHCTRVLRIREGAIDSELDGPEVLYETVAAWSIS